MIGKKKDLREELKKSVGATQITEKAVDQKLKDYKVKVVLTGNMIAMFQNLMSIMLSRHMDELVAVAPNAAALAETLQFVQGEMLKMMEAIGLEVPADARVIQGHDIDDSYRKMRNK